MILIKLGKDGKEFTETCEWSLGEPFPSKLRMEHIHSIIVTHEEIAFVRKRFPTFPLPDLDVITIPGVLAQYIFANLGPPQ